MVLHTRIIELFAYIMVVDCSGRVKWNCTKKNAENWKIFIEKWVIIISTLMTFSLPWKMYFQLFFFVPTSLASFK